MSRVWVIAVMLCPCLLFSGCWFNSDMIPGDSFQVADTLDFFFRTGKDSYATISNDDLNAITTQLIASDVVWKSPDGVDLENGQLDVCSKYVAWRVGDTEFSVPGYEVIFSALVKVAKDAQPGKRTIVVEFANLQTVADLLKAEPDFLGDCHMYTAPKSLSVYSFRVYGSKFARNSVVALKYVALAIIIVLCGILFLVLHAYAEKGRSEC